MRSFKYGGMPEFNNTSCMLNNCTVGSWNDTCISKSFFSFIIPLLFNISDKLNKYNCGKDV